MRRWLGATGAAPGLGVSYEVACACGHVARGFRKSRYQVVRCPACAQPIFVLGRSPLPSVAAATAAAGKGTGEEAVAARPLIPWPWRWPLAAAILTLGGVVLVFWILLRNLDQPRGLQHSNASRQNEIDAHLQAGRTALSEGSFRLAEEQLAAARTLRDRQPQALGISESRSLNRLYRQAALLASPLPKSLEEVLQQASGLRNEEEWRKQFEANYQGRGVVFDDRVQRDAARGYRLMTYELRAGFGKDAEPARLEIGNLKLLHALPLDAPQRLLFGAQVAAIAREPPGVWVIRFEPDSGVLLTDLGAVAAYCPQPVDDELRELVKRQAEWEKELP